MEADMRIAEQAAEWLVRLEDDDSAECRTAFFDWLKQSAWHVREFLFVSEEWRALDGMDAAKRIDVRRLIGEAQRNVVALSTEATPRTEPSLARETGRAADAPAARNA